MTSVAATPPTVTPVVLVRLTPVSVTVPPPLARLTVGVKDVMVGGVAYVYALLLVTDAVPLHV